MVVRLCYADNRMANFVEGFPINERDALYDQRIFDEIKEGFFNEHFNVKLMNLKSLNSSSIYIGFWDTLTNFTFQLQMAKWQEQYWIDGFPEILPINIT